MGILVFVVGGFFFLTLFYTWIAQAIERHRRKREWERFVADLKRRSARASKIEKELLAQGVPWTKATLRAWQTVGEPKPPRL